MSKRNLSKTVLSLFIIASGLSGCNNANLLHTSDKDNSTDSMTSVDTSSGTDTPDSTGAKEEQTTTTTPDTTTLPSTEAPEAPTTTTPPVTTPPAITAPPPTTPEPTTPAPTTPPPVAVKGISVSVSTVQLTTGKSQTVKADISPSNAADKRVTWSSSDTAVATVSSNGKITAVAAGSCVVTAFSAANPAINATVQVSVSPSKEEQARVVAMQIANSISSRSDLVSDLDRVGEAAYIVSQYCAKARYTMEGEDYCEAYGVFISGEYSCAGSTRALGMVLSCMGYSWEHVNENLYTHQWCRLTMDGQIGYADGQVGWAEYGKHPMEYDD